MNVNTTHPAADFPTPRRIVQTTSTPAATNVIPHATGNKVELQIKVQYGTERYYPRNHIAEQFLRIQGGKTLQPDSFPAMKALGYKIEFYFDGGSK